MNGKINAVNDTLGGTGIGIYVNGNIKHQNNSPIINLNNKANIKSTGTGIYSAGFATYNINGAIIEGVESGLGIKSGIFNIINGTIRGTGEYKIPSNGNNNGINHSGASIQIESNPQYAGNIDLNIKNGLFESINSNVIYEYTVNNTNTKVKSINIDGGTYISNANKDVFLLSNSFQNIHQSFITNGTFSSNPVDYLKSGYNISKNENSLYEVANGTINNLNNLTIKEKRNNKLLIISIITILLGLITYFIKKEFIKK